VKTSVKVMTQGKNMGWKDFVCCGGSPSRSCTPPPLLQSTQTESFNLLLLGADGSGKSTFIRQMQIIHDGGFSDDELASFKPDVYRNLTDAMSVLVEQVSSLGLALSAERLEDTRTFGDTSIGMTCRLAAVSRLWSEDSIQECYRRRAEYSTHNPINVSARYFLDHVDRIAMPNYLPTTEDVIRMRRGTEGVINYEFNVPSHGSGHVHFKITDVGGERTERSKWIEQIDRLRKGIICVIFLAAVDEFDTKFVWDDHEKNKLKESVELFHQLRSFGWLRLTSFILFLNKVDVFREKIQTIDIQDHFPQFQGFPDDYQSGIKFIHSLYTQSTQKGKGKRKIFVHETCATDTTQMRKVFGDVKETILNIYLDDIGLR